MPLIERGGLVIDRIGADRMNAGRRRDQPGNRVEQQHLPDCLPANSRCTLQPLSLSADINAKHGNAGEKMQQALQMFSWEQEPVIDRAERLSRQDIRATSPAAIPFVKNAIPAAIWEQIRDAPQERDRVLSPLAITWCAGLPAELRPVSLCAAYPRIANRLALSWKDQTLAILILDSLLNDTRGGRQGFPPDVASELARLRRQASSATVR